MKKRVPFLVDCGVRTGGTDCIGTDSAVMLPVQLGELDETDLTLWLLLVVVLVTQPQA
jgi:hypothetical protein